MPRKPKGVEEFEKLLYPLSQVPKAELERQVIHHTARAKRKAQHRKIDVPIEPLLKKKRKS